MSNNKELKSDLVDTKDESFFSQGEPEISEKPVSQEPWKERSRSRSPSHHSPKSSFFLIL